MDFATLQSLADDAWTILHSIDDECANNSAYITVKEAASLLGITEARVKRLVYDGTLLGISGEKRIWIVYQSVYDRLQYIALHGKPRRGKARK